MSIALETEWLGIAAFFGPPVLYLSLSKGWSARYEAYYQHLSRNSRVFFLQGLAKRIVFPLVWTIFFLALIPLSGFLYWFTVDPAVSGVFNYNLGLGFYWVSVFMLFPWMGIFFGMEAPKSAFFWTIATDAAIVGHFAMNIIVGAVPGAIFYGLLIGWMVIATMWTTVAAFFVPPYKSDKRVKEYLKDAVSGEDDESAGSNNDMAASGKTTPFLNVPNLQQRPKNQ
jgi:hypothetical protein